MENYNQQGYPSNDDTELCYIYSHGRLTCPPGYNSLNPISLPTAPMTNRYVANMTSLVNICIRFVVDNLGLVESLDGFPDVMGRLLYQSAEERGNIVTKRDLELFTRAYPSDIIQDLSLRNKPEVIYDRIEFICLFTQLQKLDVHGCKIGDGHELLNQIATLSHLEHLDLSNNHISDGGIQLLTAPHRIMARGFSKLQILHLGDNIGITDLAMKYLCSYPSLHDLTLTGTNVTSVGVSEIEAKTGLKMTTTANELVQFSTRGWAVQLVHKWCSVPPRQQPPSCGRLKARTFYGKPTPDVHTESRSHQFEVIRLQKEASDNTILKSSCRPNVLDLRKKTGTRTYSSKEASDILISSNRDKHNGQTKPSANLDSTVDKYELENIMKGYTHTSVDWPRASSLLNAMSSPDW